MDLIPFYFEFIGIDDKNGKYVKQSLTFEEQADFPSSWACGGNEFYQYFIDCAHKERHLLCDNDGWTQDRLSVPKLISRANNAWNLGIRPKNETKEIFFSGQKSI